MKPVSTACPHPVHPMHSGWSARRHWWGMALVAGLALLAAPRSVGQDGLAGTSSSAGAAAGLESLERAFQGVVEQVAPCVVGIRAQRRLATVSLPGNDGADELHEQTVVVNGSGTVIGDGGLILTNEHVIQSAEDINVLCHDGQQLTAAVVASDARSDLAILRIARDDLPAATLCDWSGVARGQWIVVLGNPFGLALDGQLCVSVGIISNLGRQLPGLGEVDDRFYNDMIQVTAPISPGNSGGPLFNLHGEMVGILTAMHTRAPADEGIGFAIPLTPIKRRLIETLSSGQHIEYGYVGLTVRSPDQAERQLLGVGGGVVVQRVDPDGPAANAGINVDDIITEYDGQPVAGPAQLADLVGQSPIDAPVSLNLLRDGVPAAVSIDVRPRDVSRVSWMRGAAISWRGLRLTDLSTDSRRHMDTDGDELTGVVVLEVRPDSPADLADISAGDVIDIVGDQPVRNTLEFLGRVGGVTGTLTVNIRGIGIRAVKP